jgi:uncharacterized protein YdeI (YjbR/CyaY-like superfamily)
MVTIGQQLHFARRDEWRTWLEANHATASEAWLVIYKKHTGKHSLTLAEAVEAEFNHGHWTLSRQRLPTH